MYLTAMYCSRYANRLHLQGARNNVRSARNPGHLSMMRRLPPFLILLGFLLGLTGCSTMTDLITSNLPKPYPSHGRPAIEVKLRDQRADLYKGNYKIATSRVSSGREGHRTPLGRFSVIRKDPDHRSSLYGDYVNASGKIVRPNVDVRKDRKPAHSSFLGAPMPYFVEFSPGYGLHAGYLPGVPASHGCIRLPYWKARQFYNAVHVGTPVVVKP